MLTGPISLAKWSQREVQSLMGSLAHYTRFVLFSKFFLVFLGALLMGLVVILPLFHTDNGARVVFSNIEYGEAAPPRMVKPKFQGTDDSGQPYNVTADYAVQKDTKTILLEHMNADIFMKDGKWLALSSNNGALAMDGKSLHLEGNVSLFYDQGFEMHTEAADVDIGKKSAQGTVPVAVQGPMGILRGMGFTVPAGTKRIIFTGPVHMTLYPRGR